MYRKFRNQKRLLNSVLELPSAGFVFFVNKTGKLIRLNECGKRLLNVSDNIPKKKHLTYYCQTNDTKQIVDLVEHGLINKIPFEQKINIMEDEIMRE
jgi:signal transduction histidine kinase